MSIFFLTLEKMRMKVIYWPHACVNLLLQSQVEWGKDSWEQVFGNNSLSIRVFSKTFQIQIRKLPNPQSFRLQSGISQMRDERNRRLEQLWNRKRNSTQQALSWSVPDFGSKTRYNTRQKENEKIQSITLFINSDSRDPVKISRN